MEKVKGSEYSPNALFIWPYFLTLKERMQGGDLVGAP